MSLISACLPDPALPTELLGGMSPAVFMRRHWQRKPLLIRQAVPQPQSPLSRQALFDLASQDGIEARLVQRTAAGWSLKPGPLTRAQLPALKTPGWTLLVQGVDLHEPSAHDLLSRFRFIPDARLDDLMMSFATDGGGVGPHVDSYDVFLLQVEGRRRWRIGRLKQPELVPDVPLKILRHFVAEEEWLLEPGDMLYLPPRWAHDGVAEGPCITCSIGFRAPPRNEFAREVLQRTLDAAEDEPAGPLYKDPRQPAVSNPGQIPPAMQAFAIDAVTRMLADPSALGCSLGEWLSEPKPQVWFDEGAALVAGRRMRLDRRTRMLYDDRHIFINGESFVTAGRDAVLLRQLCDQRFLAGSDVNRLSRGALDLLDDWARAGWLAQPSGPT